MLSIAVILKHYKNKDIQVRMLEASKDREVAVRFLKGFFGKRPDSLQYKGDVLEFAKKEVSSFHVSEEIWGNVNILSIESNKNKIDKLRKGWDFILDVDCPDWQLSKIITHLLIKALKDHGVSSISLKFSGNKGFHIAVPYEAFPEEIFGVKSSYLFPEVPRGVSEYLLGYIEDNYVEVDGFNIKFDNFSYKINDISKRLNKKNEDLYNVICSDCKNKIENHANKKEEQDKKEFICSSCDFRKISEKEIEICGKCKIVMEGFEIQNKENVCKCGSKREPYSRFNAKSVIEVDTLLISTRHLYRLVYSLHEKSALASIPVNVDRVLDFSKEEADPDNLDVSKLPVFLDRSKTRKEEAKSLVIKAFEKNKHIIEDKMNIIDKKQRQNTKTNTQDDGQNINTNNTDNKFKQEFSSINIESLKEKEELFPPCIRLILNGITDGKKRAEFALINFFRSIGLNDKDLEKVLLEWNKKNAEPLKESILLGQLKYRKTKETILPPNCDNRSYYIDIGVCKKDALCERIKNPVNYYKIKHKDKYGDKEEENKDNITQKNRVKLTKEQLEMRKKHREELKKIKTH